MWPQLLADDESRKASFRALGKFFDDFFLSEARARYNLTVENVLVALSEHACWEELARTPRTG